MKKLFNNSRILILVLDSVYDWEKYNYLGWNEFYSIMDQLSMMECSTLRTEGYLIGHITGKLYIAEKNISVELTKEIKYGLIDKEYLMSKLKESTNVI